MPTKRRKAPEQKAKAPQISSAPPGEEQTSFPIVGIGASAGGLEAFEQFFTHMPPDSGMAFVLVQHLDPTHESILTDLLKKYTRMPVSQVANKMPVAPNQVYVIPPNRDMALVNGTLHLMAPTMPRGLRLPIDYFFRSLAADQKDKAICIVLSGTGADGTLGLKTIKGEGGLTIVQSPESAHYDGMPVSAISTGLVDVVLPPEKIAEQLVDYVKRSFGAEPQHAKDFLPGLSDYLHQILVLLREHTGHDFSGYKENTITRRIERRMTVNQIAQVEDYLSYLQHTPLEIETLFRELLIGVTSFFRDHEAFESLEQKVLIPLLTQPREHPRQLRIWIPGCSTGEEAYSVAMLLQEQMELIHPNIEVQIFATDIDQTAIEKAREGRYPDSIAADVSPERLQRFFVKDRDNNLYQVNRQIRDLTVFAVQSVIKDPPFSKLDLICCRNLMIYLGPELQQKLLPLFHYALNPGGFLFLGNSETLGSSQRLFHTIDRKWKIFQRVEISPDIKTVLEFPTAYPTKRELALPAGRMDRQVSVRESIEQLLLLDYTPNCVVINEKGEMLYVHGRTGKYLEQTTGEVSTNILQVAREGLRMPLTTTIRKVSSNKRAQTIEGISVRTNGDVVRIKLTVTPITQPAAMQGLMLVIFTELAPPTPVSAEEEAGSTDDDQVHRILELEQELKSTREYLQTTIEELETANEELKSSNEELQSSNEELQSTNEELQTSKEELQSVNEELVTVNSELQNKVDEVVSANNDIKNLLDNTQVGIIFLDVNLRIRRFTPSATQIVDLITADAGRPLGQFVHNLHYDRLVQDAREVLDTLNSKEIEVQTQDTRQYLMRIMPYRTLDNRVDGVVLTFSDVTQIKRAEEEIEQFAKFPYQNPNPVLRASEAGQILYANPASAPLFAAWQTQVGQSLPQDWSALAAEALETGLQVQRECQFQERTLLLICIPVMEAGYVNIYGFDITARKQAEEALRESENKFSILFSQASLPAALSRFPDHVFVDVNDAWAQMFGYTREETIGKTSIELGVNRDAERRARTIGEIESHTPVRDMEQTLYSKSGDALTVLTNVNPITINGQEYALTSVQDITRRKHAEEALRETRDYLDNLLAYANAPIIVWDRDFKITRFNGAFERLTGLKADAVLGRELDILFPEDRKEEAMAYIRRAVAGERLEAVEIPIRHVDGTARTVLWNSATLYAADGTTPVATIAQGQDITERVQAEEALKTTLTEKEVLMREIYHRVKNNLQALIYLMDMQADYISDESTRQKIQELQERARSMALVHEKLYQSQNLAQIDFGDYLRELVDNLSRAFEAGQPIVWHVVAENALLGVDTAIPCGLIVTELLANAMKYAFPAGDGWSPAERGESECKIAVEFRADGEHFTLVVADNGVGLPSGLDWTKPSSLGLQLIDVLARHQLGGQVEVDAHAGTAFKITFTERNQRG
jgi:two-component system CheB/CheR fusion protein